MITVSYGVSILLLPICNYCPGIKPFVYVAT